MRFFKEFPRASFSRLTHFGCIEGSTNDSVAPHMHSGYEIFFFSRGTGELLLADGQQPVTVTEGDILITAPRFAHTFVLKSTGISYYWLGFHIDGSTPKAMLPPSPSDGYTEQIDADIRDMTEGLPVTDFVIMHNFPDALPLYRDIHEEIDRGRDFADRMIYLRIIELFTIITRRLTSPGNKDADVIEHLKEYIKANIDKPVTLGALADMSGLSPSYVSRRFKEVTGVPPIVYANDMRIEKAKMLLANGANVTATALAAGFDDIYYFSALFKKKIGRTPSSYMPKKTGRKGQGLP